MEELDLREFFKMFWKRKIQIILIIILFAVAGFVYSKVTYKPVYTSTASLLLVTPERDLKNPEETVLPVEEVNKKIIPTYCELIKSKKVLNLVAEKTGVDVGKIQSGLKVEVPSDTEIIKISMNSEDKEITDKVVNETTNSFIQTVEQIYNKNNIQLLEEATKPSNPSNSENKKDILVFAVLGFIISIGYVIIANIFKKK